MPDKLVCFCLTTSGRDCFAAMQVLAVQTVRHYLSEAKVCVLVDAVSHGAIQKTAGHLFEVFDRVVDVKTSEGSAAFRNRWVKTQMRRYIEGDFLYLDADLVVRGDISHFWDSKGDIAGVQNGNVAPPFFSGFEQKRYQELGWDFPSHGSLNGGVLFWRDSAATHRLTKRYHERWLEGYARTGQHDDQQALNRAIDDEQVEVEFLPPKFNAMEIYHPKNMKSAHIWHFMNSNSNSGRTSNHWERIIFQGASAPDPDQWTRWVHPYMVRDPVAWIAFRSMLSSERISFLNDWRRLWLLGNRRAAITRLLKDILISLFGERARRLKRFRQRDKAT